MVDWEITANTIFCDDVNDEVTLLISGNGTVKCTGRDKYARPTKYIAREIKQKSKQTGKQIRCLEDTCPRLPQYRDKLLGEK